MLLCSRASRTQTAINTHGACLKKKHLFIERWLVGCSFVSHNVVSCVSPLLSCWLYLPTPEPQDLSALSYTSILGVLGTVYTAVVMGIRFFDKRYVCMYVRHDMCDTGC